MPIFHGEVIRPPKIYNAFKSTRTLTKDELISTLRELDPKNIMYWCPNPKVRMVCTSTKPLTTEDMQYVLNQLLDAHTLSCKQGPFLSKKGKRITGKSHFKPGEWKDASNP